MVEITKEKEKDKENVKIIVNGREKIVDEKKLSYEQLIVLAFEKLDSNPNIVYTVNYSKNGKEKGSLVIGEDVRVKEGMIFNVTRTDRS